MRWKWTVPKVWMVLFPSVRWPGGCVLPWAWMQLKESCPLGGGAVWGVLLIGFWIGA
jgi:hypothetical protein